MADPEILHPGILSRLPFDSMVCGRFPRHRFHVFSIDAPRETTPEIEAAIAIEWTRQTERAAREDRILFNGDLFRYVAHVVRPFTAASIAGFGKEDDGLFELTVGPTCYRDFVGTNLFNRHRAAEWGLHRFANPVGTTTTILTADGLICYGRRSRRVAYHAGHVHTFGGALEAEDRDDSGAIDAFGAVARELHEELGLRRGDLRDFLCVGLIRDREIHQPELLFEAQVDRTAAQLRVLWEGCEARDEHDDLVTLPNDPDSVVPFIHQCGPIAPVAIGALMLHGRLAWGASWYTTAAAALARRV